MTNKDTLIDIIVWEFNQEWPDFCRLNGKHKIYNVTLIRLL